MEVKLVTHTPDPLTVIYAQARMTTASGDFDAIYHNKASIARKLELVTRTLDSEHWSVTRGVSFTFSIGGVSRACSHQLVRHVQGVSWEQQSQRYKLVDVANDWFVTPPTIAKNAERLATFMRGMAAAAREYQALLDAGVPGEDARMVLPNAARTNLVSTWSFEALHNFLGQRLCTRAQWEIRAVARAMRHQLMSVAPWAAPFLTIKCIPTGLCTEHAPGNCPLLDANGGRIRWAWAQPAENDTGEDRT